MFMRRKIISAVLAASVLLGAMAFSGCQNKNHGKVEKVSKDSDWFDLTTIELGEKYKDMGLPLYFDYKSGKLYSRPAWLTGHNYAESINRSGR